MRHLTSYKLFESAGSFDAWFKNSQVVDDNGKPLVVYHQTNEKFDKFDINKSYTHSFWFTSDKSKIERGETGANNYPGEEVIVMGVYLSIQKMAGWDEYDKYGVGELIQMGYDGIQLDDDYVVFDAKQIKSINNKTFNPKSDNIYESENSTNNHLKLYENFNALLATKEDEDRITITALIDKKEVGHIIIVQSIAMYWYFEDNFSEDEYDNMFPDDALMNFEHLEVSDDYKGSGIAKQLIDAGIKKTKECGFKVAYLNASPIGTSGLKLRPLVDLYKKYGFIEILDQGNNIQMILNIK